MVDRWRKTGSTTVLKTDVSVQSQIFNIGESSTLSRYRNLSRTSIVSTPTVECLQVRPVVPETRRLYFPVQLQEPARGPFRTQKTKTLLSQLRDKVVAELCTACLPASDLMHSQHKNSWRWGEDSRVATQEIIGNQRCAHFLTPESTDIRSVILTGCHKSIEFQCLF